MKIEALTLAFERLGVELAPMDARTCLLRADGGHARLTHEESDVLFVVDGAVGSLVLREEIGLTGKLAALTEVETGDDEFDDRFIVRGHADLLDDEVRQALLALPPPLALTLGDGRLRIRISRDTDEATLAYGLVRAWSCASPGAFPPLALDERGLPHKGFAPDLPATASVPVFDGAPPKRRLAPASGATSATSATSPSSAMSAMSATSPPKRAKAKPAAASFDDDGFLEAAVAATEARNGVVVAGGGGNSAARDPLLAAVRKASSSFAGAVERVGDVVEARIEFARDVVAKVVVSDDKVALDVESPQADVDVKPQRGLKGALAALGDMKLRIKGLDDKLVIHGDAHWLPEVAAALSVLAPAPRFLLRVRSHALSLEIEGHDDVVATVAAALAVAYRGAQN